MIAAVIFIILAIMQLSNMFSLIKLIGLYPNAFSSLLQVIFRIIAYGIIVYALFAGRRDIVPCIGIGLLTLIQLFSFTSGASANVSNPNYTWNIVSALAGLIGWLGMTLIVISEFTKILADFKDKVRRFWYIPTICVALQAILFIIYAVTMNYGGFFSTVFADILLTVGILLCSLWCITPEPVHTAQNGFNAADGYSNAGSASYNNGAASYTGTAPSYGNASASYGSASPAAGEFYCSMALHVVLLLFTCGIWLYIWIYRMTRYTNIPGQEERNPAKKLLLCMFIPFYNIYWVYKTAQRVDLMARQMGIASDIATICLVLEFFIPIVPPILMQDKMNAIAKAQANPVNGFNSMNSAAGNGAGGGNSAAGGNGAAGNNVTAGNGSESAMINNSFLSGNPSGMPYGASIQYQPVYQMNDRLYMEGSPIILENGALLKHPQNGQIFAQLRFKSISPDRIAALKVLIHCLDSADRSLGEPISHEYLDLNVGRDQVFGENQPIYLPDPSTRSFTIEVAEVIFADKHLWNADGKAYITLPAPNPLENNLHDFELQKQYKMEICPQAQYVYFETSDLWYCACGAVNHDDEQYCHACGTERQKMKILDPEVLKEHTKERVVKEMDQQAAEKAQEEARRTIAKARNIKIAKIAVPVVIVIIAVLIVTQTVIPNVRYNSAVSLMDEGNYTEAITAFENLGDLKDSKDKIAECKEEIYTEAEELFAQGSYDEAKEIYNSLGDYSDSEDKASACDAISTIETAYENAVSLMNSEDYESAYSAFSSLIWEIEDQLSSGLIDGTDTYDRLEALYNECVSDHTECTALIPNSELQEKYEPILNAGYSFSEDTVDQTYDVISYSVPKSWKVKKSTGSGNPVYYPEEDNTKRFYQFLVLDDIANASIGDELTNMYKNASNSITPGFLMTYSEKFVEWNEYDNFEYLGMLQINGQWTAVSQFTRSLGTTYHCDLYIKKVSDQTILTVMAVYPEGEEDDYLSDFMATLATVEAK